MTEQGFMNSIVEYQEWSKELFNRIKGIIDQDYENIKIGNIYTLLESEISTISNICEEAIEYIEMLEEEVNDKVSL